jgi:integrase
MQQPQPYFRKFDGWWYVQLRLGGKRKQVKLAKGEDNKPAALTEWHKLLSQPEPQPAPTPVNPQAVVCLLDEFLGHVIQEKATKTADWYRHFLTSFAKSIGTGLQLADLKVAHVTDWLKSKPKWSSTTKNCAVQTIRACFRWHWMEGRIPSYPLPGLRAPRKRRREVIVSSEKYAEILAAVRDARFKLYLQFLYATGCRPQEASSLRKRHVQLAMNRVVFPPSESKGGEHPRVIYLNDEAKKILAEIHPNREPDQAMFLNSKGKPWNRNSVRCRFRRLRDKVGGSYCAYHFRHSFATRGLEKLDPITLATLMGHADGGATLAKTYQHLAKNPAYLQDAVKRATS